MKKKRKYDITHRVIRARTGDYAMLLELSQSAGIPMAEALHQVIQMATEAAATRISPAQIPMPAFRVPPAEATTAVNGHRQVARQANGHGQVARVVKQRGGIRHE